MSQEKVSFVEIFRSNPCDNLRFFTYSCWYTEVKTPMEEKKNSEKGRNIQLHCAVGAFTSFLLWVKFCFVLFTIN